MLMRFAVLFHPPICCGCNLFNSMIDACALTCAEVDLCCELSAYRHHHHHHSDKKQRYHHYLNGIKRLVATCILREMQNSQHEAGKNCIASEQTSTEMC